jgi:hypothetical protein
MENYNGAVIIEFYTSPHTVRKVGEKENSRNASKALTIFPVFSPKAPSSRPWSVKPFISYSALWINGMSLVNNKL